MATYVIGDVQGCDESLAALLEHLSFRRGRDRLWFAGDLVNRGPASLAVLRRVRDMGADAITVLGNHDLHLVATAAGVRPLRRKDTFADVLEAPDGAELIGWLRRRPLLHRDPEHAAVVVHAGLPPVWSVDDAAGRARELEAVLADDGRAGRFLRHMYGDEPARWDDRLEGPARLRYITNALTRMRFCGPDGSLDLVESGPPGSQAAGLIPWYELPGRWRGNDAIAFGHWATLALACDGEPAPGVHHLDTGCVWGGRLTALRLEDRRRFSVAARETPAVQERSKVHKRSS